MEDLYIQIENGNPVNHPAYGGNLLQFYSSIPDNWQPFVRVKKPFPDVYQVVSQESTYEFINGVWTDVWQIRDMTDDEKASKIAFVQALPHPSHWIFDESKCSWVPPNK